MKRCAGKNVRVKISICRKIAKLLFSTLDFRSDIVSVQLAYLGGLRWFSVGLSDVSDQVSPRLPSKCNVMNITRSRNPYNSKYTLHGQVLETVTDAKYLGLTISSDLSWNKHINQVTSKATRTLNFVKRNLPTRNPNLREFAYQALVRPQLEYSSSVWSPYTEQNIGQIEMVQRRAARWVKHDYSTYSSVSNMISQLGWRSLENRRSDARLLMFYKIVHGLVAMPIPCLVATSNPQPA